MRLADTLARCRACYPRSLPTLPDLCVIDIPPPFTASCLPLGRYFPVIIETIHEWREWNHFLETDRDGPIVPNLLDRRLSALKTTSITFAHYDPHEPGWPWILLCHWPPEHVALAGSDGDLFARASYSIELSRDAAGRAVRQRSLFTALGQHRCIDIVIIPPSGETGTS